MFSTMGDTALSVMATSLLHCSQAASATRTAPRIWRETDNNCCVPFSYAAQLHFERPGLPGHQTDRGAKEAISVQQAESDRKTGAKTCNVNVRRFSE